MPWQVYVGAQFSLVHLARQLSAYPMARRAALAGIDCRLGFWVALGLFVFGAWRWRTGRAALKLEGRAAGGESGR
jgi:hypothetical protein